jgi:imidazolonepropionase-like amidohydrolase
VTQKSLTFIDDLAKTQDARTIYVSAEDLNWWKPQYGMLTKYRTPEYITMRKRQYAKVIEEIPRARQLGVQFLAGTDVTAPYTYPGFSVHEELGLFVQSGMSPTQAIETATSNPARLLGLTKTWGQVAPGFTANLILLNDNPLTKIENTQKIEAVIANGRLLNRQQLDLLLKEAEVKH